MSAFDFPAPSFAAAMRRLGGFVGFARHVRCVTSLAHLAVSRFPRIAFIEAKMLRLVRSGLGALDRNGVER